MRSLMILVALLASTLSPIPAHAAGFTICGSGPRHDCVVDGDTFWLKRTKIRLEAIDAPEVSEPACAAEAEMGDRATRWLLELLNAGGWEIHLQGRDRYGRRLASLTNGGSDLGNVLISEGLAQPWPNRGNVWCEW